MENGSMKNLNQILHNLREKYDKINQLHNLTKEMDETLSYNDSASFGALVEMRQKQMDAIDVIDRENRKIIESLPPVLQSRINKILMPKGEPLRLENPLEANIFDTNRRAIMLLQKVSSLNDAVFRKMRGK